MHLYEELGRQDVLAVQELETEQKRFKRRRSFLREPVEARWTIAHGVAPRTSLHQCTNNSRGCEIENQLAGFPRSSRKQGRARQVADDGAAILQF